ncbi:YciI family protein [Chenggangzhangella methanolivorans]|uniref:YciI family protein n=1 Tax=Chenggangzhangella methanolivorans TaxID=1437009 RepID=A0A9E6RBT7_9HYPH|nr:YciI family protein [Chenggangzhangella methanolivorans]QZO01919.1 YciI family protein [Chenggangzhangella methanolivorans]
MRFMIIRKATPESESETDAAPSAELMEAMAAYNLEMIKADVFRGGDGLWPSATGFRVAISRDGAKPIVTDGPFAETKELVAGFTMIEVASREEALDWARRWPKEDGPVELEIRRVYEFEDFQTSPDAKLETWNEMEAAFKTLDPKR